jgi:hypothetical protein
MILVRELAGHEVRAGEDQDLACDLFWDRFYIRRVLESRVLFFLCDIRPFVPFSPLIVLYLEFGCFNVINTATSPVLCNLVAADYGLSRPVLSI